MAAALKRAANSAKSAVSSTLTVSPAKYVPPVTLRLGQTHHSRVREHYERTMADNLMYMHYQHHSASYIPPQPPKRPTHDMSNPYAANRPPPRPKGNKMMRPLATNVNPGSSGYSQSADQEKGEAVKNANSNSADPNTNSSSDSAGAVEALEVIEPGKTKTAKTITQLKAIQLHIMAKDTLHSRATLLAPMFQLRALSGETRGGGGFHTSKGVELIRARKNLPQWKIRRGIPCGVKVTLRGDKMYDFLGTLVEFVLPRLREWNGISMPVPSANRDSPSMTSGVVSFGMKGDGVEWFPQVEVNLDLYTKMTGMHIHFITNEKGRGSQNKARALLSGFQIPFIRK